MWTVLPTSAPSLVCSPRRVLIICVAVASVSPSTSVLTIRFLHVEGGRVNGTLDPYADPQTGERLSTTFNGELKGNMINGSYATRLPSGETQTGRWSVQRR